MSTLEIKRGIICSLQFTCSLDRVIDYSGFYCFSQAACVWCRRVISTCEQLANDSSFVNLIFTVIVFEHEIFYQTLFH